MEFGVMPFGPKITKKSRTMPMLVNCSNCRTPLQLPAGATVIRCALCQAITHIVNPHNMLPAPAPPPPPPHYSTLPLCNVPPPPPSLYNYHMPPGPPLNAHGRKKAVIVGILYRYSRHELKGCINDAKCMRYLLINKFHFPQESILMLTGMYVSLYLCRHVYIYVCICDFYHNGLFPLFLIVVICNISMIIMYVCMYVSKASSFSLLLQPKFHV